MENTAFPVTFETFIALQRVEVGRKFTPKELELFAEIVDMANESYEAARRGDADTVQGLLDAIDCAAGDDSFTRQVAGLCRGWVLLGALRGAERLQGDSKGLS